MYCDACGEERDCIIDEYSETCICEECIEEGRREAELIVNEEFDRLYMGCLPW